MYKIKKAPAVINLKILCSDLQQYAYNRYFKVFCDCSSKIKSMARHG